MAPGGAGSPFVDLGIPEQEIKDFLKSCSESGNQAYSNFKDILEQLENPSTRVRARRFLASVENHVSLEMKDGESLQKYFFGIHDLSLSDVEGFDQPLSPLSSSGRRQTLQLLELPSIFIPEAWSFTFFEGICRHPDTGFRDREVCELGTGNGWISLALAERWCPKKVIGLDINPRAIKVAWINLYLNALAPDGTPVVDREGKTLLDRVEFYESDLLAYCREKKMLLDRVIGCIPQVLNPDPKAASKLVSEQSSEEFLYDLSNYCGKQGFVEDQFGLGLIARALEESIEVMRPTGVVIFNMGGRPGQAVCERLYERRGFHIRKLWQTRVNQAADTDILSLVEIEKNSRHRFEFYMGVVSEDPISARTAWAYARGGGTIAHGLTVYEARLRQPAQVKQIFRFLNKDGYSETRSALDLAFQLDIVADEKIMFLAHLARTLETSDHFPYELPAGSERFRSQIASFMKLYFRIPIGYQNMVVLPSRSVAIENILRLYSPALALVDSTFTRWLPRKWVSSLPDVEQITPGTGPKAPGLHHAEHPVVLEAPHRADLVVRLVRTLRPQLVIISLADFEMRTATAFEQLLAATGEVGARLFLDISDYLELSSLPLRNGVLGYLAERSLPMHASILCGLVKNQVYSDLQVSFVISENQSLLRALAEAGELTYNRTPIMNQLYYGCLLHELLSFQIPDRHQMAERPPRLETAEEQSRLIGLTQTAVEAFAHPAVQAIHLDVTSTTCPICDFVGSQFLGEEVTPDVRHSHAAEPSEVRMDYGENDLAAPSAVPRLVFEGFARQNLAAEEVDPRPEILQLLGHRFGLNPDNVAAVTLGDGSASLFSRLMTVAAEERGTLLIPAGCYGNFVSAAHFFGVPLVVVPTREEDRFMLREDALEEALKGVERPWLCLCAPAVNPTGALFSAEQLQGLLRVAKAHSTRVILDTCFCGLELSGPGGKADGSWDISEFLTRETAPEGTEAGSSGLGFTVALLGGISKQFSAGGLRFGYAVVQSPIIAEGLREGALSKPHTTLKYAVKKLLTLLNAGEAPMADELAEQRRILKERAGTIIKVLFESGWKPIAPEAGLFLVASPVAFLGKSFTYTPRGADAPVTVALDSENISDAMFASVGLLINNSKWTGLPDFCRFVISLEEKPFNEGLRKIQRFKELVLGEAKLAV